MYRVDGSDFDGDLYVIGFLNNIDLTCNLQQRMPSLSNLTDFEQWYLESPYYEPPNYHILPRSSTSSTTHIIPLDIPINTNYELTVFATNDNGYLAYIKSIVNRQAGAPNPVTLVSNGNYTTYQLAATVGDNTSLTLTLTNGGGYMSYFFMKME